MVDIEVLEPTVQADIEDFNKIFTSEAREFLGSLIKEFSSEADKLQRERQAVNLRLNHSDDLPTFYNSACRRDKSWKIADLPPRLRSPHSKSDIYINYKKKISLLLTDDIRLVTALSDLEI